MVFGTTVQEEKKKMNRANERKNAVRRYMFRFIPPSFLSSEPAARRRKEIKSPEKTGKRILAV